MDRIESKSIRFCLPAFADEFVGRESVERLESFGEVVGSDEVAEVNAQLLVGVVMVALDGGLFDSTVHALDLAVRTHCQLHPHRGVQEDVSGLFILFIHGWDESLNWSSIAAHGARIDSFFTTREGA
jgi:hypothetical protein